MQHPYYSFEGFADAYALAEDTRSHISDVMGRYRDKVQWGEKITASDFMEDMALASGLGEEDVQKMLAVLRQSQTWQDTVDELQRTWEAQNKKPPALSEE
ncbi:hypothetical protein [Aneurinibacillus sp. REN35]|uniref:hypothetical protein n=1 Tax=Aneurinibacillus sp. REN35 TaxID=3237286 RepID=UPI003526D241